MAINFRKNTGKKVKINTPLRATIERFTGKPIQTNQLKRMENELLLSGYIATLDNATDELLRSYVLFKKHFPRTPFLKKYYEESKRIVSKLGDTISAETIFYKLREIVDFEDPTLYFWFERVGSKFSTTVQHYSPEVCTLVVYAALIKADKDK
jgi:hypothetical protein